MSHHDFVRIANCSGYYGDRLTAAEEMVEGGPIDVLTGDWLAELTMFILAKDRRKDRRGGYGRTFVTQMERVMGTCLERGIKVVSNAGGLNPAGCAEAVQEVAERLGLGPVVAHVEGDDLLPRLDALRAAGHELAHWETKQRFGNREALTANAYLGCWPIVDALAAGADIVITGRVSDASLVMGPAAWYHGWAGSDWDALAGACVAGHVLECGTQATGGNYAFFQEVPGLEHPGFPLAEVHADGSSVITKHPDTGGVVTRGTVTAQLLYEITGPRYVNPDVVARFDTIQLEESGPDRVRVHRVRGEPAPADLKVCINYLGGHRNSISMLLTGLDIEQKAALAERTFWAHVPGGRDAFDTASSMLVRSDHADPATNEEAVAELTITVRDPDPVKVGRRLRNVAIEMALATYPGFFARGVVGDGTPYAVYWPTMVPREECAATVVVGGKRLPVSSTDLTERQVAVIPQPKRNSPAVEAGPTVDVPLGRVVGARSGDKGGDANVGVWASTPRAFLWLRDFLTTERLAELFPEARAHPVERHEFPNLLALNFVFTGLLGDGVSSNARLDAQAKGLGEYLRARVVPVPTALLREMTT